MNDASPSSSSSSAEQALHVARARVLSDLAATEADQADVVSLVEDSVSHRRWWVGQWPEGAEFVAGLVAQDVQDSLLERGERWPMCPICIEGEPHVLEAEPVMGPDPHWVCDRTATMIAPLGELGPRGAATS